MVQRFNGLLAHIHCTKNWFSMFGMFSKVCHASDVANPLMKSCLVVLICELSRFTPNVRRV